MSNADVHKYWEDRGPECHEQIGQVNEYLEKAGARAKEHDEASRVSKTLNFVVDAKVQEAVARAQLADLFCSKQHEDPLHHLMQEMTMLAASMIQLGLQIGAEQGVDFFIYGPGLNPNEDAGGPPPTKIDQN